ncbi:unnamed protein product [Symbiodinium sp. CCMP2456]|nr:unnamed protein product [Symbiodinium sp. CCMP2456]
MDEQETQVHAGGWPHDRQPSFDCVSRALSFDDAQSDTSKGSGYWLLRDEAATPKGVKEETHTEQEHVAPAKECKHEQMIDTTRPDEHEQGKEAPTPDESNEAQEPEDEPLISVAASGKTKKKAKRGGKKLRTTTCTEQAVAGPWEDHEKTSRLDDNLGPLPPKPECMEALVASLSPEEQQGKAEKEYEPSEEEVPEEDMDDEEEMDGEEEGDGEEQEEELQEEDDEEEEDSKPMKRPATSDPKEEEKALKSRKSCAYHKAKREAESAGMTPDEALNIARAVLLLMWTENIDLQMQIEMFELFSGRYTDAMGVRKFVGNKQALKDSGIYAKAFAQHVLSLWDDERESRQPRLSMRQKVHVRTDATDKELFQGLAMKDPWPDAEMVSVWAYLYKNKYLNIPLTWQSIMSEFNSALLDTVLHGHPLRAELDGARAGR